MFFKNFIVFMLLDVIKRIVLMGINIILIMKNKGKVVFVVRIGCYVFNFCCLKLVFEIKIIVNIIIEFCV